MCHICDPTTAPKPTAAEVEGVELAAWADMDQA